MTRYKRNILHFRWENMPSDKPQFKRRRILLLVSLIMLLTGVLLALARGVVREAIVIPMLYALWSFLYMLDGIPQPFIWAVLIVFAIVIAIRSISSTPDINLRRQHVQESGASVSGWARLLSHAHHDQFARWRTAQRLAIFAAKQLAHRERIELRRARHKIESGLPDMPPQVHAYFRAGLSANRPSTQGLRAYLRRPTRDALDLDPAEAIAYLEKLAETGAAQQQNIRHQGEAM